MFKALSVTLGFVEVFTNTMFHDAKKIKHENCKFCILLYCMRKLQYKSIQNLQTLEGYIFYIFYKISQPNFSILLSLVCPSREYTFLLR